MENGKNTEETEENKTEKKTAVKVEGRLAAKPIIFWVMCVICAIIAAVAICTDCCIILKISSEAIDVKALDQSFNSAIISNGLAIIGLAIAVWAGLNIANAVERKEVEELSEKTRDLTGRTEDLDKQMEPLSKNAESISNTLDNMFQEELLKTVNDAVSHWFLIEFSKERGDKEKEIIKEYLPKLIIIENCFSMAYTLHTSKQGNNPIILQNADKGIEEIGEIIGKGNERCGSIGLNLIEVYSKFRRAEFEYYKGYATEDRKELFNCFNHAAETYIDLHESFKIFLPLYTVENERIPDYDSAEEFREMSIYFANSIGDAYSKMIEAAIPLRNKRNLNGEMISDNLLKNHAAKCIYYCSCAAHWTNDKVKNEVYFRNLGCAYERVEKLENIWEKELSGDEMQTYLHHREILSNYKKAFECIISTDNILPYRLQSVYYVFMQYSKKYLESCLHYRRYLQES